MKLRSLAFLAAGLFASALARAENYPCTESFSQTVPFNPTGEITLQNVNGAIEIRTWDRNEIRIEGEKNAKTDEELKLIELTIDTSPSLVAIQARLPRRPGSWFGNTIRAEVRFTLTVPATAILRKIESVNSHVSIEDVRGAVNASTVNGAIFAKGLGADARLNTVNGSIHAGFARLAPSQRLSFETVNGSITVDLPSDAGADLSASVVNGRVECAFPIRLASGHVSNHSLRGAIGEGGASLKAESVNGSIRVRPV
jgi:DUF4097 and DUF4098 domain-containing protein YvlB